MFVAESIKEVVKTLVIAIVLVVLVIFLFLQDWRTTLIPAITIPVSLLGTFALMKVLGFSINTLTLFGLTLATGLVVDDAIVVIENIARYMQEKRMDAATRARSLAMREIFGAVIATSLVLLAVFIPVAFFPGTTGQLYKQFALTIASTITISVFTALTLTPALAAIMLSGGEVTQHGAVHAGGRRASSSGIRECSTAGCCPGTSSRRSGSWSASWRCWRVRCCMLKIVPTGFVPDEDQGFFVVVAQAPPGASLQYTDKFMRQAEQIDLARLERRSSSSRASGFSFTGVGPNNGIMFARLKPWSERKRSDQSAQAVIGRSTATRSASPARSCRVQFPAIQGAGNIGGFDLQVEDQADLGIPALARPLGHSVWVIDTGDRRPVHRCSRRSAPTVRRSSSTSTERSAVAERQPRRRLRHAADHARFGLRQRLQLLNKSYRVYVQADAPFRSRIDDLNRTVRARRPPER